ncbi:ABC transporter ATP-binding protein [Oceanotoga sp. DSM 15011]|uniref:ABC transporter ATP-binding protein n=1 Tax=Oceanotoga sp. DSM 15011 TaxID=2984951 RepID=UPI0021F3DBC0|nr:ABC transporter ATP-binding protein [Oceanotoga sp. DSM 15011]UYP00874.1 ABC transporter ATP-binding protein [Oceanotoga sp. DSM 15011]
MNDKILEVKDLKLYYKTLRGYVKAIDGIDFEIKKGEILGVAGESGCGKSTLGNGLILLKKPLNYISGEAILNGTNIMNLKNKEMNKLRFKNLSIIPQFAMDAFSPTKKIKIFISDIVSQHGINPDKNFFDKVKERLSLVNLSPSILDNYSIELSGGMKQRLVMVISTLLDPDLLICDEVTSALDVSSQRFVANMISDFRDRKIIGSAMFITHDLSILYQVADRIMIMYAGHVAEIADSDIIIKSPKHPYTKALISSLPKNNVQYVNEKLKGIEGTPPNLLNIGDGCRFRFRCKYATEICSKETPIQKKIDENHVISCWNYKQIEGDKNA